ncbi:MAG: VTT domain-containing protein [Patescibacteria group bacterium]
MRSKSFLTIATTTATLSLLGLALLLLWFPNNIEALKNFAQKYPFVAPVVIVLWRTLSTVVPPIPGGVISLALLPILGWFQSFIFASIGVLTGTSIAFLLARKYRHKVARKFVPIKQLQEWEGRFNEKTKFFAFLGLRLLTAPVFDFVSYVAGLSKISFKTFFFANALALLPDALFFYVGEELYKRSAFIAVFAILGALMLFYSIKSHHVSRK